MDTGVIVVLTTAGSEEQADRIARGLVEAELAACVNVIGGARSTYRWKGTVTRDVEHLLIVKTTADRFEAVKTRIRELHTYELPEVIALPVVDADPAILDWIRDSVAPPESA
jgi:periplasmic divalent cation tolerance protein